MSGLSWQAYYTAAVIVLLIGVLISRKIGADVAFLSALALLLVAGIIEPGEAVAGFANPAVISVGLLYVVAQAMKETGAMAMITRRLLGRPRSLANAQARLLFPAAGLSAVLNNTPIVAMFLPVLSGWARRNNLSAAGLFMPLSFAAMLGGMCTLIGTSTNLVVSELLIQEAAASVASTPVPKMGLFTIGAVGLPVAIVGLAYILVAGRSLLPKRTDELASIDEERRYTVWMRVSPGSPIIGMTIEQAGLRHLRGLYLAEVERGDERLIAVGPEQVIRTDDRLRFIGQIDSVIELQQIKGLVPDTDQISRLAEPRHNRKLIQAVISEASPLVRRTVRESGFRTRYNAVIIAVHRAGARLEAKVGDIVLQPGDTVLLEASPGFLQQHRNSSAFYLVSELPETAELRWSRAWLAIAILIGMVAAIGIGVSVVTAALAAAMLLILSRCTTGTLARSAIDWQILLVIGATFGIAHAMNNSQLAPALASTMFSWTTGMGMHGMIAGVFVLTVLFTSVMSNNAAAALVLPIALKAAEAQGMPLMPFAATVAIAASADFITPIGYQTNLMVMGPGGYSWGDFARFGSPLTILCGIVCVAMAPLVYS